VLKLKGTTLASVLLAASDHPLSLAILTGITAENLRAPYALPEQAAGADYATVCMRIYDLLDHPPQCIVLKHSASLPPLIVFSFKSQHGPT